MSKVFCMMDTETTGLKWWHEIIEIGMILFDENFNELATLQTLVNAEGNPEDFSPEAFKINGFDPDSVSSHGVSGSEAGDLIREWLVIHTAGLFEVIPAGHNLVRFDIPKIKEYILHDFDKYFSKSRVIDTKRVADFFNIKERYESTSLLKLAEQFGIFTYEPHRALSDCRRNLEVLKEFHSLAGL